MSVTALLVLSCGKSSEENSGAVFSIDGTEYQDLQSALNAIPDASQVYEADSGQKTIKLLRNASGKGGQISSNSVFTLDLGPYNYTLEPGQSISIQGDAGMYLSGEGGYLNSEGGSSAILSEGQFLYLLGNCSLLGGLETTSEVYVDDDFSGRIEGDMSLRDCRVRIYGVGGGICVGRLKVSSEGVESALECRQKSGRVTIGTIESDLDFPVWADSGELVAMPEGRKAHVHSYGATVHRSATCHTEGYDERICSVCGHEEREYSLEETMDKAPCTAEDLVHYDAVPNYPPYGGSVEHWQCPHCLKCYSDPEGKNQINPLELPLNFQIDESLLYECDEECNYHDDEEQTKSISMVFGAVEAAMTVAELFGSWEEDIDLSDKINEVQNSVNTLAGQIDKVSAKLGRLGEEVFAIAEHIDKIESQIADIARKIDAADYRTTLKRYNALRTKLGLYKEQTALYLKALDRCAGDKEKMLGVAKYWAESRIAGTNYAGYTEALLSDFRNFDGESYISALYRLASGSYPWEHQGYNFIYQAVTEYVYALLPGYILCSAYWGLNPDYEMLREAKIAQVKDGFTYLASAYKALQEVCSERERTVRRFNLAKDDYVFAAQCHKFHTKSFEDWINEYYPNRAFPQYFDINRTYDSLLGWLGLGKNDFISNDEVQAILNYYDNRRKSIPTFDILNDEKYCGFYIDPDRYNIFGRCDSRVTPPSGKSYDYGILRVDRESGRIGVNSVIASWQNNWYISKGTVWIFYGTEFTSDGRMYFGWPPDNLRYWQTIRKIDDPGFLAVLDEAISKVKFDNE